MKRSRRGGAAFPGAELGRLTSSWTTDPGAINRWLRYELRTLRARSRQLCRGDAYAAKFVRACVDNIAGPAPFALQSKVKFRNDLPNDTANDSIEAAWWQWAQPGGCEVTGRLSLAELDRLAIRCIARDGEVLIRKIVSDGQYRLQILDIDRLDEQKNENLPVGAIKMGVQVDNYSKPVAYYILKQHPGEMGEWSRGMPREYEIVPADQIIHLFVSDWPEQVRGFPWLHAAMTRLWHLGEFENAAVINARIGASKIAILKTPNGEAPEQMATGRDSVGNLLEDAEPGQYWTLPEGVEFDSFNPTFPDASVEPFIRACLRGAAAGIGMAYHSLANDPASVNYSTARVALLEERDMWKALQQWYIDHLCYPRFRDWISIGVLNGQFPAAYIGLTPYDVRFVPKTWGWVDPEKEVNAKKIALDAKLTSRTRIAAENGEDIEEIFDEIANEEALAESKGVDLSDPTQEKPSTPVEPADTAADVPEDVPAKSIIKTITAPDGRVFTVEEKAA